MGAMAEKALEAVHSGQTAILPEEWVKTYDHFLENIQDWCVSRQLWWGHQIPAWHNETTGEVKVARERPRELGPEWTQDPDVLDTWFSSALWPMSTVGWPEATDAFQKFYPASDLETGYDILFFWVARMMMFGLHFSGKAPFARVLLSGLIVDETGDKMSKVKGNVIDPLDLIHGATFAEMVKKTLPGAPEGEALAKFKKAYPSAAAMGGGFPAFGADAVRFTLATYPPSNKRIALAPKRIEGNRHFLNKIWNATRLALDLLDGFAWPDDASRPEGTHALPAPKGFYSRWIRSRLAVVAATAHEGFGAFRIDEAANAAYHFFWEDVCAWYLELVKPILRKQPDGSRAQPPDVVAETQATLAYVLEASLRLLHPLMPFITEELWQRVPRPKSRKASVAFGPYPTKESEREAFDADVESWMDLFKAVVSAARTIRSEHDLDKKADIGLGVRSGSPEVLAFLRAHADAARFLVKSTEPAFEAPAASRAPGTTVSVVPSAHGPIEVLVPLKGLVSAAEESARIERGLKKIDKDLAALDKKLGSPGFVDRAPPEVVEESRAQRASLAEAKSRLEAARTLVGEL
jgi:valyl-tRNA synthetase